VYSISTFSVVDIRIYDAAVYTWWQDLIKCTPTSHADYDPLQKTLIITQQFLENLDDESNDVQLSVSFSQSYAHHHGADYGGVRIVEWCKWCKRSRVRIPVPPKSVGQ